MQQCHTSHHDKASTGSGRRASTGSVAPHLLPARASAVGHLKRDDGTFIVPRVGNIFITQCLNI